MHPEKYGLKWDTYSDHLRNMIKELMMNGDFADVTLVTEDKIHLKAHKNILSACSPVFKDILQQEKKSYASIYLRGIQSSEVESIIQFIYLGEARFYKERVKEFLDVARSLEIKELCNAEMETNEDEGPSPINPANSHKSDEETMRSSHMMKQATKDIKDRKERVKENGKYECVYACNQCDSQFTFASSLREHIKSKHEGVKFACDQCESRYTYRRDLRRHIRSKHEGAKFKCDQCESQFTIKKDLKRHILSKHEGVKFACDQCHSQFTSQKDLKRHILSKHEGVRYDCDQCDYQATQKFYLKTHIEVKHEGVIFGCDQCDFQAERQDSLKRHIVSKHDGAKYACGHCDYQATQQGDLKKHIEAKHRGVKYDCDKCDYQTSWKVHFDKHIRSKH